MSPRAINRRLICIESSSAIISGLLDVDLLNVSRLSASVAAEIKRIFRRHRATLALLAAHFLLNGCHGTGHAGPLKTAECYGSSGRDSG